MPLPIAPAPITAIACTAIYSLLYSPFRLPLFWLSEPARPSGEVLVAVGRECVGFNISKANIIEGTAVEHQLAQRASPALGQLVFQQKIGRQLVDGAADQLCRHREGSARGERRRRVDFRTVA